SSSKTAPDPAPPAMDKKEEKSSEPPHEVSKSSKDIAKKIPAGLGHKKKGKAEPIDVDHAKAAPDALQPDQSIQTVKREAMGIKPNNRDGWNNFLVLLADEAPQDAVPQLEKLEAGNPDFSPIPAQLAVIYQKMGDQDKASEQMMRAIRLSPENLTYRYNLAIM